MKAIIHIGTAKTGSSSIQNFLYHNAIRMQEFGIYFVQSLGRKNHAALSFYYTDDVKSYDFFKVYGFSEESEIRNHLESKISLLKQELENLPDNIHTVIFSAEQFSHSLKHRKEVKKLYQFVTTYFSDIKIACYIREQTQMCTSYYSTKLKNGLQDTTLNDFLEECTPENIRYNYYDMLNNWKVVFGHDTMDISIFDKKQLVNNDLIDDFMHKIDPVLIGKLEKHNEYENESLRYSGQVLSKAVNKVIPRYIDGAGKNAKYEKIRDEIYLSLKGKGEQPSLEIQRKIYSLFKSSNEKVRREYFPNLNNLFNKPVEEKPTDKLINETFGTVLENVLCILTENDDSYGLPSRYADIFRDVAIKIEHDDLSSAYELMKLAHHIRPEGPFIKKKLDDYRKKLKK